MPLVGRLQLQTCGYRGDSRRQKNTNLSTSLIDLLTASFSPCQPAQRHHYYRQLRYWTIQDMMLRRLCAVFPELRGQSSNNQPTWGSIRFGTLCVFMLAACAATLADLFATRDHRESQSGYQLCPGSSVAAELPSAVHASEHLTCAADSCTDSNPFPLLTRSTQT